MDDAAKAGNVDKVKFSTNYLELKDHLTVLSTADLNSIEEKAKILSFSDCLTWLGLDEHELESLELTFAKKAHARGALDAIHVAAKRLFTNMNTRNGALAALEYLKATSGTFQVDASPIAPSAGGGFSFNVTMVPEKKVTDENGSDQPGTPVLTSTTPQLAEVSK